MKRFLEENNWWLLEVLIDGGVSMTNFIIHSPHPTISNEAIKFSTDSETLASELLENL